jgi:hypothetical protein
MLIKSHLTDHTVSVVLKKFRLALILFCSIAVSHGASAGLLLNIDDFGGFAQFTMSGSDTVASGSAEMTNTQHGSNPLSDMYLSMNDSCCNLGIRSGAGGILTAGDAVSWSGPPSTLAG